LAVTDWRLWFLALSNAPHPVAQKTDRLMEPTKSQLLSQQTIVCEKRLIRLIECNIVLDGFLTLVGRKTLMLSLKLLLDNFKNINNFITFQLI